MPIIYNPTTVKNSMEQIILRYSTQPVYDTPITDLFYPSAEVLDVYNVGYGEIDETVVSAYMTTPGSEPQMIGGRGAVDMLVENGMFNTQQSFSVGDLVKVDQLLKGKFFASMAEWIASKNPLFKKTLARYIENFAVKSIYSSGDFTIATLNSDAVAETYTFNYGTMLTPDGTHNLVGSSVTAADFYEAAMDFHKSIKNAGGSSRIKDMVILVDDAVAKQLRRLRINQKTTDKFPVTSRDNGFDVDGYLFINERGRYYEAGKVVNDANALYGFSANDGEMLMIDSSPGKHKLKYLKIKNINAGMKALPMFTQVGKDERGYGGYINSMSNPMVLCTNKHSAKKAVKG